MIKRLGAVSVCRRSPGGYFNIWFLITISTAVARNYGKLKEKFSPKK
jgi:hypothetical protein